MKLDIDLLGKKNLFQNDSGIDSERLDLIKGSCFFKNEGMKLRGFFTVPQGGEMRSDLIANQLYSSSSYLGSFLKFNAITNPFSINVNDNFLIPEENYLYKSLSLSKPEITDPLGSPADSINNGVSEESARAKYVNKKIPELRAPNVQSPDQSGVIKKDGVITFGPFAGGSDQTSVSSSNPFFELTKNQIK